MNNKQFFEKYERVVRKNFYEGYNALIGELTTLEYQLENGIEEFSLRERVSDYIEAISIASMRARIYEFDYLLGEFIRQLMHLNERLNRMNLKHQDQEFLQIDNMKIYMLLNSLITFRST